jgi:hypothetical protein
MLQANPETGYKVICRGEFAMLLKCLLQTGLTAICPLIFGITYVTLVKSLISLYLELLRQQIFLSSDAEILILKHWKRTSCQYEVVYSMPARVGK